jgi:hypothetical protein
VFLAILDENQSRAESRGMSFMCGFRQFSRTMAGSNTFGLSLQLARNDLPALNLRFGALFCNPV